MFYHDHRAPEGRAILVQVNTHLGTEKLGCFIQPLSLLNLAGAMLPTFSEPGCSFRYDITRSLQQAIFMRSSNFHSSSVVPTRDAETPDAAHELHG